MALSSSFLRAAWRGTTNTDGEVIGISLDLADGRVERFALDVDSALMLAESIIEYAGNHGRRTSGPVPDRDCPQPNPMKEAA